MSDTDYKIIDEILGLPGVMLSGSKRTPPGREGHTIYWNACVFVAEGRSSKAKHKSAVQVWYGDLDLDASDAALHELATKLGKTVYVTPEQPWRFDGFAETQKRSYEAERMRRYDP